MYELKVRVGPSKTDRNGVLRLTAALEIIQDCSLFLMESEPHFTAYLKNNGLGMFLVSRQADILRLPVYGETVTARTSVFDCRGYYGCRNTMLYGNDGRPCIQTWSIGAFVDMVSGTLVRLPPEVTDTVTMEQKIPMDYLDKKILVPDLPARQADPFSVRHCDIDFNQHMNNTRYVERALEFLPAELEIKRLRLEYRVPAKEGDLLHPHLIEAPEGKWFVLLTDGQQKPYTVMEFS